MIRPFLTLSALAAGPALFGAAPTPAPLNVLFIAVDDLRPALGVYGDPHAITPNMDRLAAAGTLFERAYCQQAVCHPSRASLLTGLRPDTLGIYDLVTPIRQMVPNVVTLPQLFRQNGYQTIGRGKIFHGKLDDPVSWDSPPAQGRPLKGLMYALSGNREPGTPIEEGKPRTRGPAYERADVPDNAYSDGVLADEAVDFLASFKKSGRPFFYAVGFSRPHLPFNAPEKYWRLHRPEALWPPPNLHYPEGNPAWLGQPGWELRNAYDVPRDNSVPLPLELQKTLRHGYYAATSYVDAQIGRVLTALRDNGLDQNTLVILWGDHGYHAGDHGTWCKHTNYEVAVHSPLIILRPGAPPGRRVAAPVEFIDIYPTLAALCGLPPPSGLEGQNLAHVITGTPGPAPKGYAFSQYPRGGPKTGNPMMGYSVREDRWRYTEWLRTDTGAVVFRELYDLEFDPHVTRNLAADPAQTETVAALSRRLDGAGAKVVEIRSRTGH